MKRLLVVIAMLVVILTGCSSTHVTTPVTEATTTSVVDADDTRTVNTLVDGVVVKEPTAYIYNIQDNWNESIALYMEGESRIEHDDYILFTHSDSITVKHMDIQVRIETNGDRYIVSVPAKVKLTREDVNKIVSDICSVEG